MTLLVASAGTVLLAGNAIGLAATGHPRLAIVSLAIAVLLLVYILSATSRSSHP